MTMQEPRTRTLVSIRASAVSQALPAFMHPRYQQKKRCQMQRSGGLLHGTSETGSWII